MKELFTSFSWEFSDLFNRFITTFDWHVRDGTSLVFNKLDFWLFFLVCMVGLSLVMSKRKWVTSIVSVVFALPVIKFLLFFSIFRKSRKSIWSYLRGNEQLLLRSIFLTAVSLFFFYKTSGLYMILLVVSVAFNFALGRMIYNAQKGTDKKWHYYLLFSPLFAAFFTKASAKRKSLWIIAISAIFNLLILGYFKYAYFFTESFNEMFGTSHELVNHFAQFGNSFFGQGTFVDKILLPVGVSFFTFQNISYVVDIYRKEIKPVSNFFHYSFFVTFFPQLVMGPIVRARDFIPQITQPYSLTKDDFSWSVIQIVKGLIKKMVFADFIVYYFINKVVYTSELFPGFVSVIAMVAYSLHIYADFSGYTDIATGLSRLMGFRLKPNFNSPYKAHNVGDFWRRWHMSLGSWLKDYLYIPLGGNRTGGIGSYIAIVAIFTFLIFITQWWGLLWIYGGLTIVYLFGVALFKNFKKYVHRDLNLLITMIIGGLWHGASENFVIWGAMNGSALVIYKYWNQINQFILGKSKVWYYIKPVIFLNIYVVVYTIWPHTWHIAILYFLWFWIAMNIVVFIMRFFINRDRAENSNQYGSFWIVFFVTLLVLSTGIYLFVEGLYPHLAWVAIAVLIVIWKFVAWWSILTRFFSDKETFYERTKLRYVRFWQIFFTFNFITLTRIWFKLDDARAIMVGKTGVREYTNTEVDEMPNTMLHQIWYNFDLTWEKFSSFVEIFYIPLIVMIIGFFIHWAPDAMKRAGEKLYMSLPIWLQVICVSIIIVLTYQSLTAEPVPFVYMQF